MPMRKYKPEQIVTLLRQVEVELANGKTTPQIKVDAIKMQSYAQNTGLSWQTHSTALEKIKADVNALQQKYAGFAMAPNRGQSLATRSHRSHYSLRERPSNKHERLYRSLKQEQEPPHCSPIPRLSEGEYANRHRPRRRDQCD